MNASSPLVVTALSVAIAVDVVCIVVSVLKRKIVAVLIGLFFSFSFFGIYGATLLGPVIPIISACRLARPRSYWARHFYDEQKTARSRERFS